MLGKIIRTLLATSALAMGVLAAWLSLSIRHKQAEPAVVERVVAAPTQQILVATEDLARGSVLTATNVTWQTWPEAAIAPGYISSAARPDGASELVGMVLREPLGKGQPVRESQFLSATNGYLSSVLPAGKRAMAVRISAEHAAGGFVLPDDRVDVISVITISHSQGASPADPRHRSRTILNNIRVLAVDQTVGNDKRANANAATRQELAVVGKTATLEVDGAEAEALAAGEAAGTLVLSLRSNADLAETRSASRYPDMPVRVIRAGKVDIAGR